MTIQANISVEQLQRQMWFSVRKRLSDKQLSTDGCACLSMAIPGTQKFWFGYQYSASPWLVDLGQRPAQGPEECLHGQIYQARRDVCAIACGTGDYTRYLLELCGDLPVLFDEQARHLGALIEVREGPLALRQQLQSGTNVLLVGSQLLVLGMTGQRLLFNAELFEKCAQAYVLAAATGRPVKRLPWWVRWIAGRRLQRDQRNARIRSQDYLLPEDAKGY
ncbi:hypothetical protein [Pseudomonas sp. 5P_3.1_Bac2]|uniref:hypothetical protein n=1 Tax=Pseudomonas sp. 5P_3.1_Bac2 TaxID=2971617 RepID=UPI0021C891DE|nr:hypothetical protein [Pseudomonas sp. 5P_3.1_Bac2]MCU1717377.1 hypothetical protein [Pseudomonas sp. 5P_3.1_Bac2]